MMLRLAFLMFLLYIPEAMAAEKKFRKMDLIGAWGYVESYLEFPDGRKVEQFGKNPDGIFILNWAGWYAHIIMRPDLPRVSSGVMMRATPEESHLIAIGTLSHYGKWTADEERGTFTVKIEKSDFSNFNGITQTRTILKLDAENLEYVNDMTNAGPGTSVHAKLRKLR